MHINKSNVENIYQRGELMAPKGQENRLNFRWTSPKGLLTAGLFFALALISEFAMVSFFAGAGLTETTYLLMVSPLFHILPLAVTVVLVLSWIYLTKHIAMRPYRAVPAKASKIRRRRPRREKSTRSSMATIKQFFSKIAAPLSGSSGVSFTQRRPSFSRVALESTVTVLTMFLLSIILLSVLLYPRLFADFAAGFYSTTSPLQGFMHALANVLVPIASGLNSVASGFSKAFEGLVASQSLTGGDLLWRYVFCQIAAVLISAVSALAYVRYVINARRSR
jgi:hypothetical protein